MPWWRFEVPTERLPPNSRQLGVDSLPSLLEGFERNDAVLWRAAAGDGNEAGAERGRHEERPPTRPSRRPETRPETRPEKEHRGDSRTPA